MPTLKINVREIPELKVRWEDEDLSPPPWTCDDNCRKRHNLWLRASVGFSVPGARIHLAGLGGIEVESMTAPYIAVVELELLDEARAKLSEMMA